MKSEEKNTLRQCRYCHKEFKYESEKKRHEQSHTPQFECKVCMKKFSFLSALRRHEKQHNRVGDVSCTECNHKFRDETLLKRHMKYAHKGTFVCSKCETKFNSDIALRTHMKTHKPVAERRFHCNFKGCNKSFNFPHHLKHHELTHTNTKQYFCNICNKGFIQLHHLKTHLKSHSSDRLQCTVPGCNKKFTNEYARKRHLATHSSTIDSGISSDSNSGWEFQSDLKIEVSSNCLSCAHTADDEEHNSLCNKNENNHVSSPKQQQFSDTSSQTRSNTASPQDLTTKGKDLKVEVDDFRSCKAVLGGCIVTNVGVNGKCLCAQMPPNVDEYYMTPNESPMQTSTHEMNADKVTGGTVKSCEGCECGRDSNTNFKSFIELGSNTCSKNGGGFPELEYRTDGSIKIKETFDTDINIRPMVRSDVKKVALPFNSCKSVLGNCIVSETGMISDGCLCAKMAYVDFVHAEEIDEITPQPMKLTSKAW